MCKKILDDISEEYEDKSKLPAVLQLANFECKYQMTIAKENQILPTMEQILNTHNQLDAKLTAKMFLKMGNWIRDKVLSLPPLLLYLLGWSYILTDRRA